MLLNKVFFKFQEFRLAIFEELKPIKNHLVVSSYVRSGCRFLKILKSWIELINRLNWTYQNMCDSRLFEFAISVAFQRVYKAYTRRVALSLF